MQNIYAGSGTGYIQYIDMLKYGDSVLKMCLMRASKYRALLILCM